MNENIRKLLLESGATVAGINAGYFDDLDVEKFVELIVKECYVALNPMLRDMISRNQAYDLIKQHFGVE